MKNLTTKYHLFESSNEDKLYRKLLKAIESNDIKTVKEISPKVDLNKKEGGHWSEIPLFIAVYYDKYDIIKILLENGADVNIKTSLNKNALIFSSNYNIIKLLLEHNIEININRNKSHNFIPLLYHINISNYKTVKLLLKNDADVNIRDNNNKNALFYVKSEEMFDLLMRYGIKCEINNKNEIFLDKLLDVNLKEYIKENYPDFYKQCLKLKKLKQFNI